MPDPAALTALAGRFNVDFTGPIGHQKVRELARAWLPRPELPRGRDVPHHRPRRALYGAGNRRSPASIRRPRRSSRSASAASPRRRQSFASATPCAGRATRQTMRCCRRTVDGDAVYSHGGSVRAGDKFFGSTATRDGTPVADVEQSAAAAPAAARADRVPHAARDAKADARPAPKPRSTRRSTRSGATST